MKIDKISYQKAYVIGPYLQHRIGVEIFLDEGEKPESVLSIAKGIVDSWHKAQYPEEIPGQQASINDSLPTINRAHERLEMLIDKAADYNELLKLYNDVVKTENPKIIEGYTEKLNTFYVNELSK